jgi:hypothetical protein
MKTRPKTPASPGRQLSREDVFSPEEKSLLESYKFTFGEGLKPVGWLANADALIEVLKIIGPRLDESWTDLIDVISKREARPLKTPTANQLAPVFLMLAGFAMENLLKGRIAGSAKGAKPGDVDLPKIFNGHDLLKLANHADLEIPPEDDDLLRRMTAAVIWWGRYPVPKSYDRFLEKVQRRTDGKTALSDPRFHESGLPEQTLKMVERYKARLYPEL